MSGYDITRSNQPASGADVLSIREFFPHLCPTSASLRCPTRVDRFQHTPSIFGFVREFREECSPTYVVYRLGKHTASQAFYVQIFDSDCPEALHQPECELVLKLVPLVLNPLVNLLQQLHRFAAAVRTLLTTSDLTLGTPQLRFGFLIPTMIRHRLAVRHRGERL